MLLQNHYPRFRGAPIGRLRTLTRHPPSVDSGLGLVVIAVVLIIVIAFMWYALSSALDFFGLGFLDGDEGEEADDM